MQQNCNSNTDLSILTDKITHSQDSFKITFKFDFILEAKQLQNFLLPQAGIQIQPFESSADQGNLAEILLTQMAEYMEPSLVSQLDCERIKLARISCWDGWTPQLITRICTHLIDRVCLGQFFGAFGTHFENKFVLKCKTKSLYWLVSFSVKINFMITNYKLDKTS